MPKTDWGWEITREEFSAWILHNDDDLLVVNKPALVVCHPSKHGPWSSLIGAAREYLGVERLHMPSRLDRETSGVVVLAKTAALASVLQTGAQQGRVRKLYHAILCGELREAARVDQQLGAASGSLVAMKRAVVAEGQTAATDFEPLHHSGGFTLAQVVPHTGRLHQIRVHAAWLGHPVAGDKLYGPDETLFLEFLEHGWTARHQAMLGIPRHALHASVWSFDSPALHLRFEAPVPDPWWPMARAS